MRKNKKSNNSSKYFLNPNYEFYNELKNLILKLSSSERNSIIASINHLGRVRLAIASGVLLNDPSPSETADLFIVGDDIDRRRLSRFLKSLEASVGVEVKFVLMDKEEFRYRYGMFDRFIRLLFDGPHEKLINKLGI